MHWFYSQQIDGNLVSIEGVEAQHAVKVLRLKTGSQIVVIDGLGSYHECEVIDLDKKRISAQIRQTIENYKKRAFKIHIAIAPTKNMSRFEWFLEKSTELGIDEISPILCKNSERKNIRVERLEKVLLAATKQSQKAFIPKLNPIQKLSEFLKSVTQEEKFIAYCNNDNNHLIHQIETGKDVLILIGPEGDFNQTEVESILAQGFKPIGLGNERLRTETAGLFATSIIHLFHENIGN